MTISITCSTNSFVYFDKKREKVEVRKSPEKFRWVKYVLLFQQIPLAFMDLDCHRFSGVYIPNLQKQDPSCKGCGTLLLECAVIESLLKGSEEVECIAAPGSHFFYWNLGFRPKLIEERRLMRQFYEKNKGEGAHVFKEFLKGKEEYFDMFLPPAGMAFWKKRIFHADNPLLTESVFLILLKKTLFKAAPRVHSLIYSLYKQ